MIFNSLVIDRSGQMAFYIPSVTYSCPVNTWNSHCSDIDILKRALSVLLVLYSAVMILNLMMPNLIESTMNGMLVGSFCTLAVIKNRQLMMENFDLFMTTIFGGFIGSAIFGTISLYFCIGRYLTKLTLSNLLMAIVVEVLFDCVTSIYLQFGGAVVLSIGFQSIRISFSVFLGGFLLIIGLSNLLKVGNIHRILVNNLHALTTAYSFSSLDDSVLNFARSNFINYKIRLNMLDWSLILFYVIGATVFTIRKEIYFRDNPDVFDGERLFSDGDDVDQYNIRIGRSRRQRCLIGFQSNGRMKIVSRCRRHHYRSNVIHERSPLISHWIASDESEDEVFESPNSNLKYMQTLSSESKERIAAVQNFNE